MEIIQIKEVEFYQDDRGWSLKPITDEEIATSKLSDVHIASIKPGAIRGNHYHVHKTEHILIIGSTCRVVVMDNHTKEKEEKIIEDSGKMLLIIPSSVTHAIENIGKEMSYLFCYSKVSDRSKMYDVITNKII